LPWWEKRGKVHPWLPTSSTAFQEGSVYLNPIVSPPRSRVGRMAWSLLRHPVKSREFPAKCERLVTAADLLPYGF
jgi:hypothetical protein